MYLILVWIIMVLWEDGTEVNVREMWWKGVDWIQVTQDAIQSWYLMNFVVNCKMAGDLLSNSQITQMDSAAWSCCCCALPGRLICPVRNSASAHEGYGGVDVPLQRFFPSALDWSEQSTSSWYTFIIWLGGLQSWFWNFCEKKGKFYPITCHKGPEGE
jgi:hypothetical protein